MLGIISINFIFSLKRCIFLYQITVGKIVCFHERSRKTGIRVIALVGFVQRGEEDTINTGEKVTLGPKVHRERQPGGSVDHSILLAARSFPLNGVVTQFIPPAKGQRDILALDAEQLSSYSSRCVHLPPIGRR